MEQEIQLIGTYSPPSDDCSLLVCLVVGRKECVVSGHSDGKVKVWKETTGGSLQLVTTFSCNDGEGGITSLNLHSDEMCAVTSSRPGEFMIWNLENNGAKLLRKVTLPSDVRECEVKNLEISNNYSVLSVVEPSLASLHLYIPGKKYIWTLTSHNVASKITAAKISTSGMMVVTG